MVERKPIAAGHLLDGILFFFSEVPRTRGKHKSPRVISHMYNLSAYEGGEGGLKNPHAPCTQVQQLVRSKTPDCLKMKESNFFMTNVDGHRAY